MNIVHILMEEHGSNYPNIYAQEKTGAPGGTYGSTLDLSEQTEPVFGSSYSGTVKGRETYYTFQMSERTMKNAIYVELFTSTTEDWIASRCMYYYFTMGSSFFHWGLFSIEDYYPNYTLGTNNVIDARYLFLQISEEDEQSMAIRPIVEIDLTKANVGLTGDGSSGSPYSIEAK